MFTFIHTFTKEGWKGLNEKGLWRKGDGLKIMHKNYGKEHLKFHEIAKIGGPLEQILSELKCPFYIDRFQGGVGLPCLYHYSTNQLHHYRNMLGDNFWGWQMHEWASNYQSDWSRIKEMYAKFGTPDPTTEERQKIWAKIISGEEYLFLEALTPHEWNSHRDPQNRKMYIDDIYWLYETRALMTDHQLIPADSYNMAPKIEIANGAKLLLPEVGWQIPDMRVQIAYYRGMAKAANIRWGVYYECWGHNNTVENLTIPYSLAGHDDEWGEDQLTTGIGAHLPLEMRERGGSSRNLQERVWHYAYFTGATVMGEEYGVCNTFRNYDDFDLSPYGQVKKNFLDFTERVPDVGTAFTPFAIVLPKELPYIDLRFPDEYAGYSTEDASFVVSKKTSTMLRDGLRNIFGSESKGNAGHTVRNGGYPDVFDMVHEDTENALDKYDYLIDLTGNESFAKEHPNTIKAEDINGILDKILPLRIESPVHTAYNKTKDGWLVLAMNNDGIDCNNNFEGDKKLPDCDITAKINYKNSGVSCKKLEGTGSLSKTENGDFVELEAGQWIILAVTEN